MTHDLFSSLDSFAFASSSSSLMVCDGAGQYRPAVADEVLQAAQRVLTNQVRGANLLDSPAVVNDFLRMLNPYTQSERLSLDQNMLAMQHFKNIARRVTGCKDNRVSFNGIAGC